MDFDLPIDLSSGDLRTIVVFGNAMLPHYRHGDRLIVSETAPLRPGDRVLVQTARNATIGGTLVRRDHKSIVLTAVGQSRRDVVIDRSEVGFLGRIIWASQ